LVYSTSTEVKIEWDPPVDNGGEVISGYEVYFKLSNQDESQWTRIAQISDINTLEYVHTGLSSQYDVQYRVRAESLKGFGPYSIRNTFVLAGLPTITAAPLKVKSSRNSIEVSWVLADDGGSPITGYRLY